MPGHIFINYRRADSQSAAGRLFDRLVHHFPRENLFMDVDGIAPGVDFVKSLDEQVANCAAFITVIGPDWVNARGADGSRRLDDGNDYVRIEIESALKRDIRVIPVLVDGARMPRAEELPESLRPLTRRNAVQVTHVRFASDVDDLAKDVQQALGLIPANSGLGFVPGYQVPRKPSLIELLFSFQGRISRKQYLLAGMAIGMLLVLVQQAIALIHVGGDWAAYTELSNTIGQTGVMPPQLTWAIFVSSLPFMWPLWALELKRLHDFGQGWALMLPIMLFGLATNLAMLLGYHAEARHMITVQFGVSLLILLIKGTTGPNEYGPDPLAAKRLAKMAQA